MQVADPEARLIAVVAGAFAVRSRRSMFQSLLSSNEPVPATVRDTTELRDVDVDQRPWMVVLVSADRLAGDTDDATEPVDPAAHDDVMDLRGCDVVLSGDVHVPKHSSTTGLDVPLHLRRRLSGRHRVGPAESITHSGGALGPESSRPLPGRCRRDHEHLRRD